MTARHSLADLCAGDRLNDIRDAFQVLNVQCADYGDASCQEVLIVASRRDHQPGAAHCPVAVISDRSTRATLRSKSDQQDEAAAAVVEGILMNALGVLISR